MGRSKADLKKQNVVDNERFMCLSDDVSVYSRSGLVDAKDVPNLSPFRIFLRERGCFSLFRKAEVSLEKEGRGR